MHASIERLWCLAQLGHDRQRGLAAMGCIPSKIEPTVTRDAPSDRRAGGRLAARDIWHTAHRGGHNVFAAIFFLKFKDVDPLYLLISSIKEFFE